GRPQRVVRGNQAGVPHAYAARGARHGTGVPETIDVHRDVDLVRGQDGGRGPAGHDGLELAVAGDAAGPLVDELPQRDRHRRLVHGRPRDASRDRVHPGAALRLGAETREPLGAAIEDVRYLADRLDVVHYGRRAERALDGRERRLELRPALLAFEGRDEPGLLAADVGTRAPVHRDVAAVTQIARPVRFADRPGAPP